MRCGLWRFAAPIVAIAFLSLTSAQLRADTVGLGLTIGSPSVGVGVNAIPGGAATAQVVGGSYTLVDNLSVVQGTGTYDAWVYAPDSLTGFTTIVWDLQVATGDVGRVTLTNFGNYITDVYQDGGAGSNAVTVHRSSDGVGLQFDFGPGGITGNTVKFIIKTNSPVYTAGSLAILDNGTDTVVGFSPVPLPPAVWAGLSLMGLMGIKGYRRQRLIKAGE